MVWICLIVSQKQQRGWQHFALVEERGGFLCSMWFALVFKLELYKEGYILFDKIVQRDRMWCGNSILASQGYGVKTVKSHQLTRRKWCEEFHFHTDGDGK